MLYISIDCSCCVLFSFLKKVRNMCVCMCNVYAYIIYSMVDLNVGYTIAWIARSSVSIQMRCTIDKTIKCLHIGTTAMRYSSIIRIMINIIIIGTT